MSAPLPCHPWADMTCPPQLPSVSVRLCPLPSVSRAWTRGGSCVAEQQASPVRSDGRGETSHTGGEHGASACSVREDEWVNLSPHYSDAHLSGREVSRHLFIFVCSRRHSKPYSMFLKRGSDWSTVSFYAFTVRSFSFWCYRWQPLVGFSVLEKPDDIDYDTTATTENKPLFYICCKKSF